MAFTNPDYTAALQAVNDATNRLAADAGKLSDVVTGVATRVQAIADALAATAGNPTAADVATAVSQMTSHVATLNQVSDALDAAETTLTGIAANPATPVPVTPPVVVPDVPPVPPAA